MKTNSNLNLSTYRKPNGVRTSGATSKHVAWVLLGQFISTNTVLFLTENRKQDVWGIRRILGDIVAPALKALPFAELSLTTLARRHDTDWQHYARLVLEHMKSGPPKPGYQYVEL